MTAQPIMRLGVSNKGWALLLPLLALLARAAPTLDHIPDLSLHAATSLAGDWQTIVDPYETGFYDYRREQRDLSPTPSRAETYYLDVKPADAAERVEYDFDTSPTLRVPGDWNTQRAELLYYEGTVWYRRTFDAPALTSGQRAFLRFGAVNYEAHVYLNGRKVGAHVGGFTPFSFEVGALLRPGRNSLVVKVDNQRHRDAVPTVNTDWWNYGGITRDVRLVVTPATFIADHRLALDSEETHVVSGWAQLDGPAAAGVAVELELPELGEKLTATTDAAGRAAFRFTPRALELWSPESPRLYELRVRAGSDAVTERVGFRTIRTRGKQILLNGRPVFLRGISLHEEFPLAGGGRVTTPEQARQLFEWAKELGCNFVRLAHYPHSEAATRLADELGLLIWSEVPVYWTIDWTNPATYANARAQLLANVARDANRASIIIWSLANETPVGPARTAFLTRLAGEVRALDSTRLLSAAMEKHSPPDAPDVSIVEDPLAAHVDVVAFNQYIGWYDGLPEKLDRTSWRIPYDKPVFVSEFGADARAGKHGLPGERWTEEFQEDLYRRTLAMLDKIDGFAGCSPWILVDFRSPRRVLPGVQDGFNRKGLISSDGVRKKAFFVLRDYYAQKRAAK